MSNQVYAYFLCMANQAIITANLDRNPYMCTHTYLVYMYMNILTACFPGRDHSWKFIQWNDTLIYFLIVTTTSLKSKKAWRKVVFAHFVVLFLIRFLFTFSLIISNRITAHRWARAEEFLSMDSHTHVASDWIGTLDKFALYLHVLRGTQDGE